MVRHVLAGGGGGAALDGVPCALLTVLRLFNAISRHTKRALTFTGQQVSMHAAHTCTFSHAQSALARACMGSLLYALWQHCLYLPPQACTPADADGCRVCVQAVRVGWLHCPHAGMRGPSETHALSALFVPSQAGTGFACLTYARIIVVARLVSCCHYCKLA